MREQTKEPRQGRDGASSDHYKLERKGKTLTKFDTTAAEDPMSNDIRFDTDEMREQIEAVTGRKRFTPDEMLAAIATAHQTHETVLQLNHIGYMERFIANVRGQVMYVPGIGWHIYRNQIWEPDETNDLLALTAMIPREIQQEYAESALHVSDAAYQRALTQASSESTRLAVLRLAAADPRMKVRADQLNRDPLLLAVRNGTLDLRTATLRAGRPEDYITQRANVEFDPTATCPRFDELLRHAFRGDVNMIAYVWRALGYCLTALTAEQVFFFLWGVRGSSKTTIAEIMVELLGTYAQVLDEAALTGGAEQHPTWVVDLLGKRLVVKDELDHRRRINTARLNALTGGSTQRGRRMRADFTNIMITAKIMITTNHRPPMGNAQDGIWRRIHPWHFTAAIDENRKIKDYARLLVAEEGPGILNGCLRGLRDYLDGGLGLRPPRSVLDDAEAYREAEDDQAPFITDVLINTGDPADWVANPDLYAVYMDWCEQNGVSPMKGGELSKLLVASGFVKAKPRKATHRHTGKSQAQRGFIGARINITSPALWDVINWSSSVSEEV